MHTNDSLEETSLFENKFLAHELTFSESRNPRALETLIHTLHNDQCFEKRFLAAEALGKINDDRSMHALYKALKTENISEIRVVIIDSIENLKHFDWQ